LEGEEPAIDQFIDAVWMRNISDNEQANRDGFGLALLGIWDGNLAPMEVTK
jgi:CRISPR-associated protein Cmr3